MRFLSFLDLVETKIHELNQDRSAQNRYIGYEAVQTMQDTVVPNESLPRLNVARCDNKSFWGVTPIINQDFPDSEPQD